MPNGGEIPTLEPVRSLATVLMGQSPPSSACSSSKVGLPFLQGNAEFGPTYPKAIQYCRISPRKCEPGDVLVSVRAPVGEVNLADQDYVIGRGLSAVRPTAVYGRYLWHALRGMAKKLDTVAQGTTFTAVGRQEVESIEIPRFDEFEEISIAHILDTVDAAIEQAEALIAKLEQVQCGLLHDLLTNGLPNSTSGLLKRAVGELCETFAGGTPPRSASGMYGGGILWVKSGELGKGSITCTEETITELGFAASSAKKVPANVPLVAMYGATAGAVGWLTVEATTNQAVLACVPKSSATDARWLYWRLLFDSDRLISAIQGSGQPNLNKGLVDRHAVDIPPTPDEQSEIASILDTAEAEVLAQRSYLQALWSIKAGLTDDLLSGRVRVPAELEMA